MQLDDEILQDFLIEAQEILERLDSQLVALEAAPDDHELLNAVFRGFHTIKGGAGFLSLDAMVEVAHKAEDVFGLLREGKRQVTARLMDVILQVLDTLRGMFEELNGGQAPHAAAPELLAALISLAKGEDLGDDAPAPAVPAARAPAEPAPLEEAGEFDDVVAQMMSESEVQGRADAPAAAPVEAAAGGSELISDDEFETLLDNLHGKGQFHAETTPPPAAPAAGTELISDDEFEALLDNLHGKGQFHVEAAPAAAPAVRAPAARAVHAEAPAAAGHDAHPSDAAKAAQNKDTTVRVETEILDRIMNMVGELVLIRNRLTNLQASIGDPEVTQTVSNLDVVTSDLQMAAMKTRMQPIKKVFGRFPRVVRDLARSLKKEIELVMIGEDTDLDKNLVEALSDPLVHLVRNAVDHGIEGPDQRAAAGKPRTGVLTLAAEQSGDQILLTIKDDGRGMDADVLRAKAVEKGLLEPDAAARLSQREAFELIFLPGFSTKEQISDVSGRGVGMDVVKTRITQLNGSIEIDSTPAIGTTIRIRVPLTLAILPTLMVVLKSQIFALPLVNVKEIIDFKLAQARDVNGRKMLVVRGKALPLYYLSHWLVDGVYDRVIESGHVVIVAVGSQHFALLVDELIGQEEVVIKPLGAMLHGTKGLAGATITGNGRIALILDLPELVDAYARRS
ncbi:MAG: chemotaxis protein CheA [Gammaproteobacteria bacterium]|nr:chemotaxis protein CheA [Gammaproteobacteria bacterium]